MSGTVPLLPAGPPPAVEKMGNLPSKCGVAGCSSPRSFIFNCFVATCPKRVHSDCFTRLIKKFNVPELVDPISQERYYVCSKTCYNWVDKNFINTPSRIPWDRDGKEGPNDPNCSQNILLKWLLTEGNYTRFRGNDNHGKRKLAYGLQISLKMKEAGCRVERSGEAVVKKIQEIEGKFIKAHDWAHNTGQGVRERDGMETFQELVRQRCKWYFELEPIMADRSKARPKATTETLLLGRDDFSVSSGSDIEVAGVAAVAAGAADKKSSSDEGKTSSEDTKPSAIPRSSTKNNSVKKRKKQSELEIQEIAFMQSFVERNQRKSIADNRMSEKERHNRAMEAIEEKKTQWKNKKEELEYKKELLATKKDLEEQGHDMAEILALLPDLAPFYGN